MRDRDAPEAEKGRMRLTPSPLSPSLIVETSVDPGEPASAQ